MVMGRMQANCAPMNAYRTLVAWQLAHQVCIKVLRGIDDAWQPHAGAIMEQLRRAVISIEANIVEGHALRTPAYFKKHARIAFGSAAESEILLQDCLELEYLPEALVNETLPVLNRCMRTLRGLLNR